MIRRTSHRWYLTLLEHFAPTPEPVTPEVIKEKMTVAKASWMARLGLKKAP